MSETQFHLPLSQGSVSLPHPLAMLRHALPALAEGIVGPAALFYVVLETIGLHGAIYAALGFSYAAIVRRLLARQRPSGTLLLGAVALTARTALALVTGSAFVYFLQPTLGTFLTAALFLASARFGEPLAARLARDFCPLDPSLTARPRIRRFFLRVTLLWTAAFLANSTVTLWLLLTASINTFVLVKMLLSPSVMAAAVLASVLLFRQTLRGEGLSLSFAPVGGEQAGLPR